MTTLDDEEWHEFEDSRYLERLVTNSILMGGSFLETKVVGDKLLFRILNEFKGCECDEHG